MEWSSLLIILAHSPVYYPFTLIIAGILLILIKIRYRKGLRQIPGPFLASFLPLDRLVTTANGHQFKTHIKYHERYGSMVRVGPNHVSFSNGALIPVLYGISTKFYDVDTNLCLGFSLAKVV
jgi:hypothetical protein